MSALGQKQTYAVQQGMSALPPRADMCSALTHVCFVPMADIGLLDHFIRRTASSGNNQADRFDRSATTKLQS